VPGVFLDRPNREAVAAAGRVLCGVGHDTVVAEPTYPTSLRVRGIATWLAGAADAARAEGVDRAALQPRSRRHADLGEWALRHGYVRQEDRDGWRERSIAFFADKGVDLLLMPALAAAPPKAGGWARRSWTANMLANVRYAPYAAPWNVAGLPALVVPIGVRPDGLPVAAQLVGPPGTELLLLAVAGQIEMHQPWRRHAPSWPRVPQPAGTPT
jgi:amidase